MPQPLSSKEASLFRQVVKNYESKQNKKGLKTADQILKKVPNHGDTQAMKALILNSMGQSDEAFPLAKKALNNDMKSHVCWHVYGLLWRSQRNYEEAIKAYKFALRLEPDSPQILRDLSLLQVQLRDYQGYIDSRKTMLQKRQVVRQNWTALAIAHHLAGDLKAAENVLNLYEGTLKNPPPKSDIEHNEAVLYKNMIIAEMGEFERALEHLESVQKTTLDRTAVLEMRADYLLRLGKMREAEQAYRDLLARNSEYRSYYEGLERSLGLDKSKKTELKGLYGSYAQKHDRTDAARRIPLDFLEGTDFREAADHYLRRMLHKGVPSTFNNIKSLYSDESKRNTIQDLAESYASEKQVNGSVDVLSEKDENRFEKSALYFLAQHYNYKITRDLKKAMSYTERLIEMSPKTYDFIMNKARIHKHLGNLSEAAKIMDQAREMDLRDRYINTKCAKYQLRNDDNELAIKTMSKFTRNEVIGGTLGDLIEMQSLWYLLEDGEAYARRGRLGLALKRFHTVYSIFETWHEDQFDFHLFSLRKAQIRAYIDMMRWENQLQEHPYYTRAAIDAIHIYVQLHDHPALAQNVLVDGVNGLADPKAAKKAKQEEEKKEAAQREADRKAASKKSNIGQDGEVKKSDDDPKGKKLLETKDPLREATKFLAPMLEFGASNAAAQHVGFEVYLRKRKYYLALKCLLASFAIDPVDPIAHSQALSFRHALQTQSPDQKISDVLSIANDHFPPPYNDPSAPLSDINNNFLSQQPNSLPHLYAFADAAHCVEPSAAQPSIKKIFDAWSSRSATEKTLQSAGQGIRTLAESCTAKREELSRFADICVDQLAGNGREVLEREIQRAVAATT